MSELSELFGELSAAAKEDKKKQQEQKPVSELAKEFENLIVEARSDKKVDDKMSSIDTSNDFSSLMQKLASEAQATKKQITEVAEEYQVEIEESIPEPVVENIPVSVETQEVSDLIQDSVTALSQINEAEKSNIPVSEISDLQARVEQLQRQFGELNASGWGQRGMEYGSGEVRLEFLDDVDRTTAKTDEFYLKYQTSTDKWIGAEAGGGVAYVLQEDGYKLLLENEVGSLIADEVHQSVSSGVVSGTDLILTMGDGKTVTIDATELKNLSTAVSIAAPNWYQTYASPGSGDSTAGLQVNTLTPVFNTGPHYFGLSLARGSEFLFDHGGTGETRWIGIWGGGSSYATSGIGTSSYWTRYIRFDDTIVSTTDTKGFDLTASYSIVRSTTKFSLTYDYTTNKLQLWEIHMGNHDYSRTLITTATVAEDGNPVTISVGMESSSDLPIFSNREHTWNIIAQVTAGDEATVHDGLEQNSVAKHNVGLHPGEKMVITTPGSWTNHYIGWDYTGAAIGETGVQAFQNQGAVQIAVGGYLLEYSTGWTINEKAQEHHSAERTNDIRGNKISFRYNLDNSMDLFDEENEEVLFNKDVDFDGSTVYMHIFASTTLTLARMFYDWSFEPFAHDWYVHSASSYVGSAANDNEADRPNQRHIYTGTGPGLGPNAETTKMWGELMYPGQELAWPHTTEGFVADERTSIGLRNATDTIWLKYITYEVINFKHQPALGFDRGSWYGIQNNDPLVLRYDFDDHKLKIIDLDTPGQEYIITTALVAEDGGPIRICLGGLAGANSPGNALVGAPLRYYGWEYIHRRFSTPGSNEQQWKNWRLDRPSANDSILANTVLRHRRGLIPGQYFRWTTVASADAQFFGKWVGPSSGESGITSGNPAERNWNWGWRLTGQNRIELHEKEGMAYNTSNPNYNATAGSGGNPAWTDPAPGTTQIQLRYNSDNSIDLYDVTNSAVILTKDVDGDGNLIQLDIGRGGTISDIVNKFSGIHAVVGTI